MKKIISKKYGEYLKYEKEDDIFDNKISKKELQKEAFKYLVKGNNNFGKIIDKINNTEIQFRRISGSEYVMGSSNNCLSTKQYK